MQTVYFIVCSFSHRSWAKLQIKFRFYAQFQLSLLSCRSLGAELWLSELGEFLPFALWWCCGNMCWGVLRCTAAAWTVCSQVPVMIPWTICYGLAQMTTSTSGAILGTRPSIMCARDWASAISSPSPKVSSTLRPKCDRLEEQQQNVSTVSFLEFTKKSTVGCVREGWPCGWRKHGIQCRSWGTCRFLWRNQFPSPNLNLGVKFDYWC